MFGYGLYLFVIKKSFNCWDINDDPRLDCIYPYVPNKAKILSRHIMTVLALSLEHGKQKGKRENLSTTHKKKLFFDVDGKGPLKSMFNLSIGFMAFIRV